MSGDGRDSLYLDREISKLSYFARLLQEARDPRVPLYGRIELLAIFSGQLDEFFRVRVASLLTLLRDEATSTEESGLDPGDLFHEIQAIVNTQQEELGRVFWSEVMQELNGLGIYLVREDALSKSHARYVSRWYARELAQLLRPEFLGAGSLELKNGLSYLAVRLREASGELRLAIVEIPSTKAPRFLSLPERAGRTEIIFLDDVIRFSLGDIFPGYEPVEAHAIKLTRDAELYLDDEFSEDIVEKIRGSLERRDTGLPSRFLYDPTIPDETLRELTLALGLTPEDMFEGSRYHNWNEFADLPLPERAGCSAPALIPLSHPDILPDQSIFEQIQRRDFMLYFPYQSYDPVLRFLREASLDPDIESIMISLYRVASDSEIVQSLVRAADGEKAVTAFVEVKARFDEESNIYWAKRLEEAGATVVYRCPGLKVHSKLCVVSRREGEQLRDYTYVSTGNFNEKSARTYCDFGVFTSDPAIGRDAHHLFEFLQSPLGEPELEKLVVAPFTLRKRLTELVDLEIRNAQAGKPASILLKVNNLEGPEFIEKLYEASAAGVKVRLIVRSICCLVPGVPGLSENIEVISIVDRFLEHARIYIFHNGGDERFFVASADLMTRNLSKRIEVVLPVPDPAHREVLRQIVELQWSDHVKARIIDSEQSNRYRGQSREYGSSQEKTYELFEKMSGA